MNHKFLTLILLAIVSCNSQKQNKEAENLVQNDVKDSVGIESIEKGQVDIHKEVNDTLILVNLNKTLFHDFINVNAGPFASKNDSGYYSLNLEAYFNRLDRMGIFSTTFYDSEKKRVSQCQKDLEELRFTGETELGWEPESCSFFNYMYWIKSQESPTDFETKEIEIKGKTASAQIVCFDEFDGVRHYWKGIKVEYQKDDQNWKVTNIFDK